MSTDWQFWMSALATPVPWLASAPLWLVMGVLLALIGAVLAWQPNRHPMNAWERVEPQRAAQGRYHDPEEMT